MNALNFSEVNALQGRLAELTGVDYVIRGGVRAGSGFANTTWLLDSDPVALVVKVQSTPSVVYERDPTLEPTILEGLASTTVPVPAVVAREPSGSIFDTPWFAMTRIEGRCLPDDPATSYAARGWYAESSADSRALIWNGFVDTLADLHKSPNTCFGPSPRGGCHTQVLDYLEASLHDGVGDTAVPAQQRILGWLRDCAPLEADSLAVPCMADARMANLLERDGQIVALLDWELAWIGNPCGDIGYHLYLDSRYQSAAGRRLSGLPEVSETWDRWQQRTGYEVTRPRYWEVFGGFVMAITATRAMAQIQQKGLLAADMNLEAMNVFVTDLVAMIDA